MKVEDIINKIYSSEIPCRLEWFYDAGFTWSIQDGSYPRIAKDDDIDGRSEIIYESAKSMLLRHNPLLEKDWIIRGCNSDFKMAVKELAEAICGKLPNSEFSEWYNNN